MTPTEDKELIERLAMEVAALVWSNLPTHWWDVDRNFDVAVNVKAFATRFISRYLAERGKEAVAEVCQGDINQIVWLCPSLGVGRGSKLFAAPPAIPEGMKLVPVDPTKNMQKAALGAEEDAFGVGIYRAMIAAAPEVKNAE